ncbi:ClpXP protease specificity-enhancing factor SspB [Pseudophaeobacter sp.]|uniref:ClpXP protease specificity-enhancing factor SspB n=1 Tax=Pseudophaeobacter sp. TaxID=1971739 RepID=UPI003299A4F4
MTIFISYAREDRVFASQISNKLDDAGVEHWIDTKSIKPGQDWKREISIGLRSASHILLLISENSISKRGYVQREIKEALEFLKEVPTGDVFIIPVRLEPCEPHDLELRDLNWFDLFPDINRGIFNLIGYLKTLSAPAELEIDKDIAGSPRPRGTVLAPYKAFSEVVRVFFAQFPKTFLGSSPYSFYLTVRTQDEGVQLPPSIAEKFPETVSFVIQNQYEDLLVNNDELRVSLWFYGEKSTVIVPIKSLLHIASPELGFTINHDDSIGGPLHHILEGHKRRISELETRVRSLST